MLTRTTLALSICLATTAMACVSEEVPTDELGEASAALHRGDDLMNPRVDKADLVSEVTYYSGLSWAGRRESNSWNWSWGSGRSGMSSGEFDLYGLNKYCGSYSWLNRCNSSLNTFFITPGWGANFKNYWGQPSPSGWSTAGQHPFWCPNTGGTWQGWSTSGHC